MRRACLMTMMALVTACGGQHLVGTLLLCCFDMQAGVAVPSCETLPFCVCLLDLCGQGAACRQNGDCPAPGAPKPAPCLGCVSGRCGPTMGCTPPPPPSVPPSPTSCSSDSECSQLSGCTTCRDGSSSCYVVRCLAGACTVEPPSCACRSDADCAAPASSCERCPDGVTDRCLVARCSGGQCLMVPGPACAPTASCRVDADCGKATCVSCPSGMVCGSVFCGAGSCQTIPPSC